MKILRKVERTPVIFPKIKLMADVTILASPKNSSRSGIFFTAYEIVQRFKRDTDIELFFYCNPRQQKIVAQFLPPKTPLYPYQTPFDKISDNLRERKWVCKQCKQKYRAKFWHTTRLCMRILLFLPNLILKKIGPSAKSLQLDAFWSPMAAPPPEIRCQPTIKKYIVIHDTTPLILAEYFRKIQPGDWWFPQLIKYMKTAENTHYFANSQATKNDFLKYVPNLRAEQITITHLACRRSFHPYSREATIKSLKKYNLPTDQKYVFSLCTLEPRKNLIRAVSTFVQFVVKNKIDDIVFILGGGHWGTFIGQLNAKLAELGDFKDKIIKAGYIDDEDLAPLYSGAEWFVYTSQYEGFGLPPLEAMACGCPVVASNNSSIPEVVGDAGILIDWSSDEQHIDAYEKYYRLPELRKLMREKGLARAAQFSWDKTVDLMKKEMTSR